MTRPGTFRSRRQQADGTQLNLTHGDRCTQKDNQGDAPTNYSVLSHAVYISCCCVLGQECGFGCSINMDVAPSMIRTGQDRTGRDRTEHDATERNSSYLTHHRPARTTDTHQAPSHTDTDNNPRVFTLQRRHDARDSGHVAVERSEIKGYFTQHAGALSRLFQRALSRLSSAVECVCLYKCVYSSCLACWMVCLWVRVCLQVKV
jgi:hypothetical protein